MRKALVFTALLLVMALAVAAGGAEAEEAENLTSACKYKVCSKPGRSAFLTDGKYTSYWESEKEAHPWITISSDQPVYGLYLCFQNMPDEYVIQQEKGGSWETVAEGDTLYHHIYYPLDGLRQIRVYASASGKKTVTITSNKKTSRKITHLKPKKKYYVRIRTYKKVSGKKYFSEWSKVLSKKVK